MRNLVIIFAVLAFMGCKKKDEPLPNNCFLKINVTCTTEGAQKINGAALFKTSDDFRNNRNHVIQLTPTDTLGNLIVSGLEPITYFIGAWNASSNDITKNPVQTPKLISGDTVLVNVVIPD